MIQLSADLSDPLLELIRRNEAPIDAVEVGPWFRVAQIRRYRQMLPQFPFYFHGGDLIDSAGVIPGAISRITAYQRCTESPWISMHITMWLPGMVWLMVRQRWQLPLPNPERAAQRLIRQVRRLARSTHVPVVLENIEPKPFAGYDFESQPERISRVFRETGCGFLLDLGHARVSAAELGMDVHDYLHRLPLERVVQVHVSGPRLRAGCLVDAHEPLQAADYALLDFILEKTRPQVVTLEYIREQEPLREQLFHLRSMVNAHNQNSWQVDSEEERRNEQSFGS